MLASSQLMDCPVECECPAKAEVARLQLVLLNEFLGLGAAGLSYVCFWAILTGDRVDYS